jgi:hypothetical protein
MLRQIHSVSLRHGSAHHPSAVMAGLDPATQPAVPPQSSVE